jgi:hypothetical protein
MLIEKSPDCYFRGFFFIMTDWLLASSHKTLQVYRYLYRDQALIPSIGSSFRILPLVGGVRGGTIGYPS